MKTTKLNDFGIDVIKYQLLLNFHMRPCPLLMINGHFDGRMRNVVAAFQKTKGLTPDGAIGPHTGAALGLKPVAVSATAPFRSATPWLNIAIAERGIREAIGPSKHNARIVAYHQTTTLKATDDETPWCSSFVNWVMIQSGRKGTNNALAKSWLEWGVSVKEPKQGDIVVIKQKTRGLNQATGSRSGYHVGFYLSSSPTQIKILGGNQGNMVNDTDFSLKSYDIIGYRRPQ